MTTITINRATVEQALEDLKDLHKNHNITCAGTIAALEAALAQQAEPVEPVAEFDHGIGADRFKVVRGSYWWHILIGDSPIRRGKFHTQAGAEEMAALLLREFRNGAFVQHNTAPPQQAEPVQDQDVEDAIEAAYWQFDCRKKGLNEWASAPQSERDAFKAEARKLVRGYFPTRQAQDTKREMLAVADAFIRGKRAAPPQQAEPVAEARYDGTLRWLEPHGVGLHRIQGPLFTAPPQRKPLTDDELLAMWSGDNRRPTLGRNKVLAFARAVERAHNITDPQIEDRLARHGIPMPEGDPK